MIRKKEKWPCFEHSKTRFGLGGFRAQGFHEKANRGDDDSEKANAAGSSRDDAQSSKRTRFSSDSEDSLNLWMVKASSDMAARMKASGLDLWETIMALVKYRLISQGHMQPHNWDAIKELFDQRVKEHPGVALVVDPRANERKDRIAMLNEEAKQIFGPIGVREEGLTYKLVPPDQEWRVIKQGAQAWVTGRPMKFDITLNSKDGNRVTLKGTCSVSAEHCAFILYGGKVI